MWTNEHSIETAASPDAIWRLWSDVVGWPEWNADIEHIEISGPFAAGSTITMTPIGQDPIELRIAEALEPDLFVDEAEWGMSSCGPSTASRALKVTEAGSSIGWRSAAKQPTRWAPI
jgi:hypothetical protein